MEVQRIVQKHIDNAVSKTINMPQDYDVRDMSEMWLKYLPHLKGTTFYRENSRGYVDEQGVTHAPPLVALSLEEARAKYSNKNVIVIGSEVDCPSGVCEL
jgi:ribonucleotide reductase alpha subunit